MILLVAGTRPEVIKLAPVARELDKRSLAYRMLHTGQHPRDALVQLASSLGVDGSLGVPGLGGCDMTTSLSAILLFLNGCLATKPSNTVVVQGDTLSAFAGALAGFYAKVPVVHVEAGLRTWDRNPWPEETHRQLIARLATLHCCPTQAASNNLRDEDASGIKEVTGNTIVDQTLWAMDKLGLKERPANPRTVVITMHRRENWGPPMERVLQAVVRLALEFKGFTFKWILPGAPEARNFYNKDADPSNLQMIDAPPYLDFIKLMHESAMILTDSGGIQEEAPTLGVPVMILREETERPECVECGAAYIVGTDQEKIYKMASDYLGGTIRWTLPKSGSPFGDGHAAERIVDEIERLVKA